MKQNHARRSAALLTAAVLLTTGTVTSLPRTIGGKATESVLSFAKQLSAQSSPLNRSFGTLRYSAKEQQIYRDGKAAGKQCGDFRVVNGKLMVAASAVQTAAEKKAGSTIKRSFVTPEEAAERIGCEIREEDGSVVVSAPFQSCELIVCAEETPALHGAVSVTDGYRDLHVLRYETSADAYAAYQIYQKDPAVSSVEPNRVMYAAAAEVKEDTVHTDEGFIDVDDRWGLDAIGADNYRRWLLSAKEDLPEITVAVIDTGIYARHAWFEGRIDDRAAGFTYDESGRFADGEGHGSHCAGIICSATTDNVKILPLKALSDEGYGTTIEIYCAMMYALEQKADVVSMSFGGFGISPLMVTACRELSNADIPCCVAAGNESLDSKYVHPAQIPENFTISAVGQGYDYESDTVQIDYILADFSNFGEGIDFAAPGVDIESVSIHSPYATVKLSGTSMATPYAAACVANLLSYNENMTNSEIYDLLKKAAVDLGEPGFDDSFGWGMVNLDKCQVGQKNGSVPVFSLAEDVYEGVQSVAISCPDAPKAEIWYKKSYLRDGSDSEYVKYKGEEISITDSCFLHAYTVADGIKSSVETVYYEIYCKPPVLSPQSGSYEAPLTITIESDTEGAVVYYTLDGTEPAPENGIRYEKPFPINKSAVVKAVAVVGDTYSSIVKYSYLIDGKDVENAFVIEDGVLVSYRGLLPELDLSDKKITEIGSSAFYENDLLRTVILPDSVTKIGDFAFKGCPLLEGVIANGVTELGRSAFEDCIMLEQIGLPLVTEIPDYAFRKCKSIEEFGIVWENITSIGTSALERAAISTDLHLDSLETIGDYAFHDASIMGTVALPEGIRSLPEALFLDCSGIQGITAPGLTAIGKEALSFTAKDAFNPEIPYDKITSLGEKAFCGFIFTPNSKIEFSALTDIGDRAFLRTSVDVLSLPAVKTLKRGSLQEIGANIVYLENAEVVKSGAVEAEFGSTILVFGEHLKEIEEDGCVGMSMILAGPEHSPAEIYAQNNYMMYYCTPCVYLYEEDASYDDAEGFGTPWFKFQQYVESRLTAYLLGFGCTMQWYRCADAAGSELAAIDGATDHMLHIDVRKAGEFYYCAGAMRDGEIIGKSNVANVRIYATKDCGEITLKDGLKLIDWNKECGRAAMSAVVFSYTPEESGNCEIFTDTENMMNWPDTSLSVYDSSDAYVPKDDASNGYHLRAGETYRIIVQKTNALLLCSGLYVRSSHSDSTLESIELSESSYICNGKPCKPDVSVTGYSAENFAYEILTEGKDYILVYLNNTECGMGTVMAFGIGAYCGSVRGDFTISVDVMPDEPAVIDSLAVDEVRWYRFIPKQSGIYTIFTQHSAELMESLYAGNSANDPNWNQDTILRICAADKTELDYDDDGGMNLLSMIGDIWLDAGETYFIEVSAYSAVSSVELLVTTRALLQNGYVEGEGNLLPYTGEPVEPAFSFFWQDDLLTEGIDYVVRYIDNTDIGMMLVVLEGIGDFLGRYISSDFMIDYDFNNTDPDSVAEIFVGKTFTVSKPEQIFSLNLDENGVYRFTASDADFGDNCIIDLYYHNMGEYDGFILQEVLRCGEEAYLDRGEYYLVVENEIDASGSLVLEKLVSFLQIEDAELSAADLTYTGSSLYPEITVYYDGELLAEGVDYEVSSDLDVMECGFYQAVVTGIGRFTGSAYVYFSVLPDLSGEKIPIAPGTEHIMLTSEDNVHIYQFTAPQNGKFYVSKKGNPFVTVQVVDKYGELIGIALGVDLCLVEMYCDQGEDYYVVVTSAGKAEFDLIVSSDCVDFTQCNITAEEGFVYKEGTAFKPDYHIFDGETELTEGKDYRVVYNCANDCIGRAEIGFEGMGRYLGRLTYSYFIYPETLDDRSIEDDRVVREMTLEETCDEERNLPGSQYLYAFTAPKDGTFYLTLPNQEHDGVNAFVYGNDGKVLPLGQKQIEMKAGEKITILCITDYMESDYFTEYDAFSLRVSESSGISYVEDNGVVYRLEDGDAYVVSLPEGMLGIRLLDTVYDEENDAIGCFAGFDENCTIPAQCTFYCDGYGFASVVCSELGFCFAFAEVTEALGGDVTGDEMVDFFDVWTLQRWLAEGAGMMMSDQAYINADVNGDGEVDLLDVREIMWMILSEAVG